MKKKLCLSLALWTLFANTPIQAGSKVNERRFKQLEKKVEENQVKFEAFKQSVESTLGSQNDRRHIVISLVWDEARKTLKKYLEDREILFYGIGANVSDQDAQYSVNNLIACIDEFSRNYSIELLQGHAFGIVSSKGPLWNVLERNYITNADKKYYFTTDAYVDANGCYKSLIKNLL